MRILPKWTKRKDLPNWLSDASHKLKIMPDDAWDVRTRAMNDLNYFARLVNPGYMYGSIHTEIFTWLQEYNLFTDDEDVTSNKLIMLPRAHLKSHVVATWVSWIQVRHPEVTIIYLSATAELAEIQLFSIQNILASARFRRFFPEYVHPQEGKRTRWSQHKIILDHPDRASSGVRDATVTTAGLTTNTTGWHADIVISDDIVIPENAYTQDGRDSVVKKTSQFTSIRNPGGFTLACGTRYFPTDVYNTWKNQTYEVYNDDGVLIDKKPIWEVLERKVEVDNIFIWPRAIREDGKAFGFDIRVLSRIKGEYEDRVQFYAQYYNDPNDSQSDRISRDKFQYYNPRLLTKQGSRWFYNSKRLNVYAAIDFAWSLSRQADYTALVVIGMDEDRNVYLLDIDRWKSGKIISYFEHIKVAHSKWTFKKLQAEITAAQEVIVNEIKEYVKRDGLRLSVVPYRPSKAEGRKEERIAAALEHRYDNYQMWHFEGGWTNILEEELVLARPPHDDIKDALASVCTIATPPSRSFSNIAKDFLTSTNKNSRFGGASV